MIPQKAFFCHAICLTLCISMAACSSWTNSCAMSSSASFVSVEGRCERGSDASPSFVVKGCVAGSGLVVSDVVAWREGGDLVVGCVTSPVRPRVFGRPTPCFHCRVNNCPGVDRLLFGDDKQVLWQGAKQANTKPQRDSGGVQSVPVVTVLGSDPF